ncbi:MAG: hypothetical protein Q4B13_05865 [Lautropia sp.]|nr:hypothetical protein [Lautropia sp.]
MDIGHSDMKLPPQYDQARQLAEQMLQAARLTNWDEVRRIRKSLPSIAQELENAWQELRSVYPDAGIALESQRIRMIREILQVDEQIRQLGNTPAYKRIIPWMTTRPRSGPTVDAACTSQI